MDAQAHTPIARVEGGPACAAYLCEQLELPVDSIKTYGDLVKTIHLLRDRLNTAHGETIGAMKYMAHLEEMNTRALASIGGPRTFH
jgi:hypothetical protein